MCVEIQFPVAKFFRTPIQLCDSMMGHEMSFRKPCLGEWITDVDECTEKCELKTEFEDQPKEPQITF